VVSELDGPIVDQRHIVRRRLLDYDRVHGTNHFSGVELAEVDVDAGNLERFITRQGLPATGAREILDWCRKRASSTEHGPDTVRPYPGALEVIRWFQLQESTFVGLNTSRPERLRADTLHSLNAAQTTVPALSMTHTPWCVWSLSPIRKHSLLTSRLGIAAEAGPTVGSSLLGPRWG